MKRVARIALGLAAFLAAAALGLATGLRSAPQGLRAEAERLLGQALGAPVSIGEVRVGLGWTLLMEGRKAHTWDTPAGPMLEVERVLAGFDLARLLLGRFHLRHLALEGARLRIERAPDGSWSPAPFAHLAQQHAAEGPAPEPALAPIRVAEAIARFLLEKRLLADRLEIRDSRVLLVDAAAAGAAGALAGSPGAPGALGLEGLRARVELRPLGRGARLELGARLYDARRPRGRFESVGSRGASGALRLSLATTELELGALRPYLPRPAAELVQGGVLSGAASLEVAGPGESRLDLDLVLRGLALPPPAGEGGEALRVARAETQLTLELRPGALRLPRARVASGDLDLRLEGEAARPLGPSSRVRLAVSSGELALVRALAHLGWLPPGDGGERVEAGSLVSLLARGAAPLSRWQEFLRGRGRELPEGFSVEAEIAGARVRVGETDRLEDLRGRVSWSGDRVRVREARSLLNGVPLPELNLELEGISRLFATDPAARLLSSGGKPLRGLATLWRILRGDEPPSSPEVAPSARLAIARLEHPMLLWPLTDLEAEIEPAERGVHVRVARAIWAGAPIGGEADWVFEPSERLRVRLAVGEPGPVAPRPAAESAWAHGRFALGPVQRPSWRQTGATGAFTARGSEVELEAVEVALAPAGRLAARGTLDLGREGEVPVDLGLALEGGDLDALLQLAGVEAGLVTGSAGLEGSFRGRLRPERSLFAELEGRLSLRIRDGRVRRGLPAVVAIALASDMLNPFARREVVRFDRVETDLEFAAGVSRTKSFVLDGPDLRVFASGSLAIAEPPHELEAEVALYLFRQMDRVIEKIPLVNLLLLGEDESILAAYYELSGPWSAPEARLYPLRTIASGPASLVLERVPGFLRRGLEALGSALRPSPPAVDGDAAPPARAGSPS
jgi:hypothetical protein